MGTKKWHSSKKKSNGGDAKLSVVQEKCAGTEVSDENGENFMDSETPPKWYDEFKDDPTEGDEINEDRITSLRFEAQKVLDDETKFYNSKLQRTSKGSDVGWIRTVLEKGTAGDKMAALIVSVQNSPVHNLNALNSLISMVKVAKKRQCIEVMSSLSELFVGDLLKPDLKLKTFERQPLSRLDILSSGNAMSRRLRLAAWMFEEKLKFAYGQFITAVDLIAKDTVETNREKAISTMHFLLESHPEQENVLLKNIVNKLGDSSLKVVSKVIYCLTQLLRIHPNMKRVVMNEVEKLLFRPNISVRTQYYAVCFLSQFVFKDSDKELARNIINIYFSFFKASIKKGEVDSRLMGALLMGVKRAYPFAKPSPGEGIGDLSEHIDTLYRLVHVSKFNIALHTLSLLQQVSVTEDRFYSALYKKLLDIKLGQSTHHAMLINLLYKALQKDENVDRVKALIKRLFQICFYLPVPLVCGLLYMISQLIKKKRSLVAFKTEARVLPSFLSESGGVNDEEEGEEKYTDVIEIKEEIPEDVTVTIETDCSVVKIKEEKEDEEDVKPIIEGGTRGWYHCDVGPKNIRSNKLIGTYDPYTRNPVYAGAENTAYFELVALANHFHPTVSLFAKQILNDEIIIYTGDPLVDFTLIRFLERFVFKNPKKHTEEPSKGPDPKLAMRKYYTPTGAKAMQVTSKGYLSKDESTIPVDELFLYRYLKERYGEEGIVRKKDDDNDDDDNDSVASEEFEEMIDNMMSKSKKKKDLDFLEDVGDSLKKSKKKGGKRDEESDEEDSGEDTGSEEDMMDEDEDEGMEEVSDGDNDDSDDIMEFSSDEEGVNNNVDLDEFYSKEESGKKKMKKKIKEKDIKKQKKPNFNDIKSLFAPAEEFAEILEETGSGQQKQGMAHTLVNKENAAVKQLNWEAKRDRWVKGMGEHKNRKRKWKEHSGKKFKKNGARYGKKQKT